MKKSNRQIWDVIVVGGGPAGMMAAARASARGRSVLLLEKNKRLGKKLSITGGGRCNVTNNTLEVRAMLANYKEAGKFLFSTFSQHAVSDTIDWFERRGVGVKEENDGRLFPESESAETICAVLEAELKKTGVQVKLKTVVKTISFDAEDELFTISLNNGDIATGKNCIIATGGTSRPETGSTGEGFRWLKELGHTVTENDFSLVPVALKERWVSELSGITLLEMKISLYTDDIKQHSTTGKILFTHTGLSGPTILNMSSQIGEFLQYSRVTVELDLFPTLNEGELRQYLNTLLAESSNKKVLNTLTSDIPKALARVILEQLAIDIDTPGHSLRAEDRARLVQFLKHLRLEVKGLLGANKAVISSGGVKLEEVDFKTMGSRIVPGLHVVGDVLDIDRPSGGYSLQLCWSTGWVAGNHV